MAATTAILCFPLREPSMGAKNVPPRLNKTADPASEKNHTVQVIEEVVEVHSARNQAFELDKNGFCLAEHVTDLPLEGFTRDDAIAKVYYKEMEELVKRATGADRCFVFDHTVRRVAPTSQYTNSIASPLVAKGDHAKEGILRVHGDYTDKGAPKRLRDLAKQGSYTVDHPMLSVEEAELIIGKNQFLIVNVWKNIAEGPVRRNPLALLDCTSLSQVNDELFTVELVFKDRVGENLSVDHKKEHRWCYFPEMLPSEALVFKTFDARQGIQGRHTLHSAFDDPHTVPADPKRESIEVRVVAILPPQTKL